MWGGVGWRTLQQYDEVEILQFPNDFVRKVGTPTNSWRAHPNGAPPDGRERGEWVGDRSDAPSNWGTGAPTSLEHRYQNDAEVRLLDPVSKEGHVIIQRAPEEKLLHPDRLNLDRRGFTVRGHG